jgi:hypothetical protein
MRVLHRLVTDMLQINSGDLNLGVIELEDLWFYAME